MLKAEVGELLRLSIVSECARCKEVFQINKVSGVIDYVCPQCGFDNYLGDDDE
jgi:Zn finger protein HypA/HybF involved in hydrogenase expression